MPNAPASPLPVAADQVIPALLADPIRRPAHASTLIWSGQAISVIGTQFSTLSIQMIAVLKLKASAAQMGVLTASQTLPYLVLSLFLGALIDRQPKRFLLLLSDLARAVILIAGALFLFSGHLTLWGLCSLVCLVAIFNLIFDASLGAVIPQMFTTNERDTVNARINSALVAGDVVGPSISGYALQCLGITGTLLFDAFSYVGSAFCILLGVPTRASSDAKVRVPGITAVLREIRDGVRFVVTTPVLRILGIGSAVWNFSWSAVAAVLVIYAARNLHFTPSAIGLSFALGGVGGVLGSALGLHLAKTKSRGSILVFTPLIGVAGSFALLIPTSPHPSPLIALALFLYNLGESSFGVNMQTARQAVTPIALMGRMDTSMRFCFKGMASLGALAGGFIASRWGVRCTLLFGTFGLVTTFIIFLSSRLLSFDDLTQRREG